MLRDESRERRGALGPRKRAAGAGRGAPATEDEQERSSSPRDRIRGPSGPRGPQAATRCCSSTRIWHGATRFTATCRCTSSAPDYDQVGTPQVGFPVAVVGFNRHAGWGRTVNTIDTVDFYRLTVKNDQYVFDGELRPFERDTRTFKVKQPDGSLREERLDIRRSVHGPVVFDENGVTVAMRVAGLDRPKMLEQWFRMGEARTLQEFQSALRMMSVPMWHANYADDQGHIMFVFDGLVPKRSGHDYQYWSRVVPGDTSETLWTDYLSFDELPKSIDPPSGWHQNANEPPWMMTAAAARSHEVSRVCRADRRGAAADAHAAFAAHDHRGSEDQLRAAPREETFDADGAGGQGAAGSSQRRRGTPRPRACWRSGIGRQMSTAAAPCCFSCSSTGTSLARAAEWPPSFA